MPYVTSIERLGIKKGREEGLKEGREAGREEGREEGRVEGRVEGLREAVRMSLQVRFGDEGLALRPELQAIEDEAVLIRIHEALVRGLSLEEVRKLCRR